MTTTVPVITSSVSLMQVGAKLEEAFRWLIEISADKVTPNLNASVAAFAGTGSDRITYPCVIAEFQSAREQSPGSNAGVWEFELALHAAVKFTFRGSKAERTAGDLMGGVMDILMDSARTLAVLNLPASPDPDERAVQEFHLGGYWVDDPQMSREGRVATASVMVRGVCYSWDVTAGGSAGFSG